MTKTHMEGAASINTNWNTKLPTDGIVPQSHYRRDIDGLRALAVLAVIGFHAFPGIVPGGFVGVDVFFVISGYLITGIIHSGLERNRFYLAGFYRRRIRRIFPALLVVLAASLLLGRHLLLDGEFRQLGKHVLGGAGFSSNFVLWGESGYFDTNNDLKPLLHLWSLGIEEQFYILWPLLLILAHRWSGNERLLVVLIVAGSFALNLYLSNTSATAAFYSPLARAWELGLGGLLALSSALPAKAGRWGAEMSALRARLRPGRMSWLGLFLIIAATFGLNRYLPYPGVYALLPTLGATLLIAAGPTTWFNARVLAHPALVGIGLISYPLYLWHWPLFAFERIVYSNQVPVTAILAALAGAFVLACATYYLIEIPARRKGLVNAWALALGMAATGVAGIGCFAGIIPPWSASFGLEKIVAAEADPMFPGDFLRPFHFRGQEFYREGRGRSTTLYIGDSTMQQYFLRVHALLQAQPAATRSAVFATSAGCPPIPGLEAPKSRRWCGAFARDAYTYALDSGVDRVVIGARWYYYFLNASAYGDYVFDDGSAKHSLALDSEGAREAYTALGRWIGDLVRNHKKVYLLLDIPFGDELDPAYLVKRSLWRGFALHPGLLDQQQFVRMVSVVSGPLREAGQANGATVIDPVASLCDGRSCSALTVDGSPKYKDVVHLRATFVRDSVTYLDSSLAP